MSSDYKTESLWFMKGDCLERMKEIPDGSVDMVLTDPPYNTTACKWDSMIPLEPMWEQLKRIIKPNGAIVIFGQEPFCSLVRVSNLKDYKYDWQWRKSRPSGFTNAKLKPLKDLETVMVFSEGKTANGSKQNMPYFPQGLEDCDIDWSRPRTYMEVDRGVNPSRKNSKLNRKITKTGYPRQVLDFPNSNRGLIHPTQKPVELMEYLIKTYTDEGETVLDFTSGSFTTGVACVNLGRNFIGIEMDNHYYDIGTERVLKALAKNFVEETMGMI
jgi:site-specific DNA-methyltransferase (adenine-specific)